MFKAYRDDVGSSLSDGRVGGADVRRNGGLGVIDDADNGANDGGSAGGSLARIYTTA